MEKKMKCEYCKGTGKYKKSKKLEKFDELVDIELNKGYFVNPKMAEEKAHEYIGYDLIECPYCHGTGKADK